MRGSVLGPESDARKAAAYVCTPVGMSIERGEPWDAQWGQGLALSLSDPITALSSHLLDQRGRERRDTAEQALEC